MEPFDVGWMQTISLVMYLLIVAHMVRVWLSLKVYSHELEKAMDAVYDIHHHMGLCNCEDPSVIVLPLSQLEAHLGMTEDLSDLANAEAIREWDEG